ncbi:dienelactone hydrolase family protein [Thermocrinis sp.]
MKFLLIFLLLFFGHSKGDEFIEELLRKLDERGKRAWWWDERWWNEGYIENVPNYEVVINWVYLPIKDAQMPVMVARPKERGKFPGVLFLHGRRGLDDLFQLHAKRLASKGFVVVAPDLYSGRFIPQFPNEHDPIIEDDAEIALNYLLNREDISSKKVCVYGLTRGGYYTLRLLVAKNRQVRDIVCFVGYYPVLQDPNRPEPMHIYAYHEDVERLSIPVLFLVGRDEQYQRLRLILVATESLKAKGKDITLVVYPGVGRGFDFRNGDRRKFADDLAAKDALIRSAKFIKAAIEKASR